MEHPEHKHATPDMEHLEHKTSKFCNSTESCCTLLRVPAEHALLIDPPVMIKKGPLYICFLCGTRSMSYLRNIEGTSSFDEFEELSVVSVISQCWNIHIKPFVSDGRRIKCCVRCIKEIKQSLSIKKRLENYATNVQGGVSYPPDKTLGRYPHCLIPSSQQYQFKQEPPDDDLLFSENDPSSINHDVKFEHKYSKDEPVELPPKNQSCFLGTSNRTHQLTEEATKNNSESEHIAKSASATFSDTHQISLPTAEKGQESSQPTEKSTEAVVKSEHMYSMRTTLKEQALSLGNQTSQLFKRLINHRPMNVEERNKLLDILADKTSNENLVAQTIFRCKSLMETLRACIVYDINGMASKLTSTTCQPGPSVLRMAGDDILQHKDLTLKAVLELKQCLPIAFDVLMALCNPPYIERRYTLPTVAMIYGMAMHTRNKDLCVFQRLNTCVATRYNPGGQLLQIFNKFAVTLANTSTINRLIHKLDVLDMEEAMAKAETKARNDVEGTLSTDQRQVNSNHSADSAEPAKPKTKTKVVDFEFSFLLDAAESCVKYLFHDKLAKNREKERSRKIHRVRKSEKKKLRGTKVGDCPDEHLLTKQHLKKRRTSPRSNIALSGRKRRQVLLQIRRDAKEKDQMKASQNPDQARLVGRVIETSNGNGEHSVTDYTIVQNTDVEMEDNQ